MNRTDLSTSIQIGKEARKDMGIKLQKTRRITEAGDQDLGQKEKVVFKPDPISRLCTLSGLNLRHDCLISAVSLNLGHSKLPKAIN